MLAVVTPDEARETPFTLLQKRFIHKEQLLEETDSDEKKLSNVPRHLGNPILRHDPILRHGDTLDLAVNRAAMVRGLNTNTRLACLLASQQEQRKLFATRELLVLSEDFSSLLLHKKPEIQCDDDG